MLNVATASPHSNVTVPFLEDVVELAVIVICTVLPDGPIEGATEIQD